MATFDDTGTGRSTFGFYSNTYFATPKDVNEDRIQIEVGDSKQADFIPQFKVMRWDNEVNFSARLIHDETAPTNEAVGAKIDWQGAKTEAHFYELTEDEGGYEFEITLKEKPASNVIRFSINTKGIDFFYQPELSKWEVDKGRERPENVVGSYAVYASEQKKNYAGGKEYRAGKVGHIYRPRIIDAVGNKTWGELKIDPAAETLTVTIPQEFLGKAVYPVTHAAGLTFGYTTSGASNQPLAANEMLGQIGTTTLSGKVDSVSVNLTASVTRNIKCVTLLASTRGILTNGVSDVKATGVVTDAWVTASYTTKPSVSASTDYYAAVVPQGTINVFYDATVSSYIYDATNSYSTPAAPSAGDLYTDSKASIYATYTEDGQPFRKRLNNIPGMKIGF